MSSSVYASDFYFSLLQVFVLKQKSDYVIPLLKSLPGIPHDYGKKIVSTLICQTPHVCTSPASAPSLPCTLRSLLGDLSSSCALCQAPSSCPLGPPLLPHSYSQHVHEVVRVGRGAHLIDLTWSFLVPAMKQCPSVCGPCPL